jgi:predicted naringenin-chalcone synthase
MDPMNCSILAIATATPPHRISQRDAAAMALSLGNVPPGHERSLVAMYRQTRIRTRGSVVLDPPEDGVAVQRFFAPDIAAGDEGPTTATRMDRYAKEAGGLAVAAARRAMAQSGIDAGSVTHLVTCSCTGFVSPGVDLQLVADLGLSPGVARTHVGFMGCHGAFNSLRVADAFAADPRNVVLVVCVELCSLHFQYGCRGDDVVANALFADGAAALVAAGRMHGRPGAWGVRRQWSAILPGSRDEMGWEIGDHGFRMRLSPKVAGLLEGTIRGLVEGALREEGLGIDDIGAWAVHPGGPRILDAIGAALRLPAETLLASEAILADHGNMSSATILFILRDLLRSTETDRCFAMAFGPGLTAEFALLERLPHAASASTGNDP